MSSKVVRRCALAVLLILPAVVGADGFLGIFGTKNGKSADVVAKTGAKSGRAGRARAEKPAPLDANLGLVQLAGHFLFEYLKVGAHPRFHSAAQTESLHEHAPPLTTARQQAQLTVRSPLITRTINFTSSCSLGTNSTKR